MIVPLERDHQVAFFAHVRWLENSDPRYSLIWASPNGGARHVVVAMKLKEEGVRKGVPDITVAVALGGYNHLYIEMKRDSYVKEKKYHARGALTPEQKKMHELLRAAGSLVEVCYTADEALDLVKKYFAGEIKKG